MEPRVQYCKTSDGVSIAYAVFGEGPPLVYITSFPGSVHLYSHFALSRRFTDQLVELGWRVIRYDARGTGSSDRDAVDFLLGAQLRDLEAVVDRLELERFALGGHYSGSQIAVAYAARHPERVSRLVLRDPFASGEEYYESSATRRVIKAMRPLFEQYWELMTLNLAFLNFGLTDSEVANEEAAAFRSGISAQAYVAYMDATEGTDVTGQLESVRAPTLVTHSTDVPSMFISDLLPLAKKVAASIPNARLVTTGDFSVVVDQFLREGEPPAAVRRPATAGAGGGLVTILFTDIEGSTALTQRLGDAKARDVLREHERITREALASHGGSEVKSMGDGFMASFGSATGALECAIAIQKAFEARNEKGEMGNGGEPVRVRIGLNAGEPISEEDDLFGTAVITAARIASQAKGAEILVSDVVRQLVAGKGFLFSDRGEQALRGFDDPVRVYEVRWREKR